ncbi:hypothetical protein ND864_17460 [Leptospira levettii]|uniref:hypothetical protein n=1 Tax=Leptospira levettii TaxID=2023178 RepID=UPI00223E36AC|nr:hypothetical protein [Leptospira levettii]MCW7467511.1 hypothetical protein [Leptospira levettii]
MTEFPSFGRQLKVAFAPPGLAQPGVMNGLELGEIDSLSGGLMKYRADIRLFNGQILKKVRLPGPYIGLLGFLSGFKFGYREGQMVLVGFLQNRRDNPIVIQVYPFAAETKGKSSLIKHSTQFDFEETSVGHESGHRTKWDKNKVLFKDKLDTTRVQIDHTIPPTINSLEKAAQGETLKSILEEICDEITKLTVPCTAPGTSSLTPDNAAKFLVIKGKLNTILSEVLKHY